MPFILRDENTTENPPLAQVYGLQITEGRLVYYIKEGGRTKCILFLGAGEMDGIDKLYYNGEIVPEFDSTGQRNWMFHAGTKTSIPAFKDVTAITTDTLTVTSHGYTVPLLRYEFTIPTSSVTAGAVYQLAGVNYTVTISITNGTTLTATTPFGTPPTTGMLTKVSGTGPPTLNFTNSVYIADDGDVVALSAGADPTTGFTLPTGVAWNRKLYVVNPTTNTFQLSLTRGGAAITGWNATGNTQYLLDNLRVYKANAGFYDPLQGRPYFFSEGHTTNEPLDFTFSEIAYVEVNLTALQSDVSEEPNKFKIFVRGRRLQNYTNTGALADQNGTALVNAPKFFSANPALVATDIMLNSMKIDSTRIDWGTFVKYRDYCAETILWDSGNKKVLSYPNWKGLAISSVSSLSSVTESPARTFTKTGGINGNWDAAIVSSESVTFSDPFQTSFIYTTGAVALGITTASVATTVASNINTSLGYSFRVNANGTYDIYNNGSVLFSDTTVGKMKEGDVLQINIEADVLKFYRNGVVVFITADTVFTSGTIRGAVSFNTANATVKDFKILYNGLINAVENPVGTVSKVSGTPSSYVYDSCGLSLQSVPYDTITDKFSIQGVYERYTDFVLGLSQRVTPVVDPDTAIYSIKVAYGAVVTIRRLGTVLKTFSANSAAIGDTFKIEIDNTDVNFYRNDTRIYTVTKDLTTGNATYATNAIRGAFFLSYRDTLISNLKFYPVTGSSRYVPRFEAHVVYPTQIDSPSALEQIFGHSPGCHWQDTDGKIKFIVGSFYKNLIAGETATAGDRVLAKVLSFDPTQTTIPSNVVENSFNSYRKPKEQRQNFLRAEFRDVEDEFYTKKYVYADRPTLRDYVNVLVDFGIVQVGVATQSQADRIAESILRWNTDLDLYINVKGTAETLSIAKGDIVKFAHEVPGWTLSTAPTFIVTEETFDPNTADERSFTLQVYNPEFYSDINHGQISNLLPAGIVEPLLPPPAASYIWNGLTLHITWTHSPSANVSSYVIKDGYDQLITQVNSIHNFYDEPVRANVVERRIYAVNNLGEISANYATVIFVKPPIASWTSLTGMTVNSDNSLLNISGVSGYGNSGAILNKGFLTEIIPIKLTFTVVDSAIQVIGLTTKTSGVDHPNDFLFALELVDDFSLNVYQNYGVDFLGLTYRYSIGDTFIIEATSYEFDYYTFKIKRLLLSNGVYTEETLYETIPTYIPFPMPLNVGLAISQSGDTSNTAKNIQITGDIIDMGGATPSNATISGLTNATYSSGTMSSTGGSGWNSSGGYSLNPVGLNKDGGFSFKLNSTANTAVGFTTSNIGSFGLQPSDMQFHIRVASGQYSIWNGNTQLYPHLSGTIPYTSSDTFFIGREAGYLTVRQNGELWYEWLAGYTTYATIPLRFVAAFQHNLATTTLSLLKKFESYNLPLGGTKTDVGAISVDLRSSAIAGNNLINDIPKFTLSGVADQQFLQFNSALELVNVSSSALFPSQTGNSGKFLKTDGTTVSWAAALTGTGTTNYLPKFTGASTFSSSSFYDVGSYQELGDGAAYTGISLDGSVISLGDIWGNNNSLTFKIDGFNSVVNSDYQINAPAFNGGTLAGTIATISKSIAANTSSDGLFATNSGTASSGNQRYSPQLRLQGQGWKSNATAASQPVDWTIQTIPIQGLNNPSSKLVFSSQINNGGYTEIVSFSSGGGITASGGINGLILGSGGNGFSVALGVQALSANSAADNLGLGAYALWQNSTGVANVGVGSNALILNAIGSYNAAIGYQALGGTRASRRNVGIGDRAGVFFTSNGIATDGFNVFIGANAGYGTNSVTVGTVTITIASPAVITKTGHGLVAGDMVHIVTTGALPTGISAGTTYYVISAGLTADAFEISATSGGAAINTSGTQSGTHTCYKVYSVGIQNTFVGGQAGYDFTSSNLNTLIGYNTGRGLTTGGKNTIVGAQVTGLTSSMANTVILADGDGNKRFVVDNNGKAGINLSGVTSSARLHIVESTLGNEIFRLETTASNDDPKESVYQNKATTSNNSATVMHTFSVGTSKTVTIDAVVIARRTSGSAGTAEDCAAYKLFGTFKNISTIATTVGSINAIHTAESQIGWDANLVPTGTDGSVELKVTGATNNDITWHMTARVYELST